MKWTNPGHQLDDLGVQYLKVRNLYIFGIDEKAGGAFDFLRWLGVADEFDISFVLDITVLNRGDVSRTFKGKPVIAFQTDLCEAVQREPEVCAVALPWIAQVNERAILEQLGVSNIFYLLQSQNRQDNFIQNFVCVWLMYKHGKLLSHWMNYLTTSKCNLNCKNCLNFNEYISCRRDNTFEEFKTHIDTVFLKFDYLYSFHLAGGEPLLVKELPEFIRYVKENYGDRVYDFFIITNGTIVPNEETITAVKSVNGHFLIDDYSDTVPTTKIEKIKAVLDDRGIGYTINKADAWFDLDIENTDNSGMTEEELETHKNGCNTYLQECADGKLYACCYETYANRVGIGSPDKADCIDIAEASKMEILEFRQGYTRRGYVNLCKTCKGIGINAKETVAALQIPRKSNKSEDRNKDKLVSICVPIYNTGKYLARCINSLLAQKYQNIQIVLADDGSTDQSGLICDEYAKMDPRIVVVHKANGGEASARNAALNVAEGEFIMFIDSDDEYLPDAVQLMMNAIDENDTDLIVGGYLEKSGETEHFATGHVRNYSVREFARAYLTGECRYGMPYIASTVNAKLFRRDIIIKNEIQFDERFVIGNDSVFMCEYLKHTHMIRDIFTPIYVYYKYQPSERVQGMRWYYPDGFFLFAYVADQMVKLIRPDEEEYKRLVIKQYKDFFYAAVNAAANEEHLKNGLLPYLASSCDGLDLLQVGARLDLFENYIVKEAGELPFRLISYLVINRQYDVLYKLIQSLSKTRGMTPFCGDCVRPMVHIEQKQKKSKNSIATDRDPESDRYLSRPFHIADNELLMEQMGAWAATITEDQQKVNDLTNKINHLESAIAEVETRANQFEIMAAKEKSRADLAEGLVAEEKKRADLAESRVTEEKSRADLAEGLVAEEKKRADLAESRVTEEKSRADLAESRAAEEKARADLAESRSAEEKDRADSAEKKVMEKEFEICQLRSEIEEVKSKFAECTQSASWRMTKPFRTANQCIKKVIKS